MKLTRHSVTEGGDQLYKGPDGNIYDGTGKLIHDRSGLQEAPILDTIVPSEVTPKED